jgi:predicted phage terminase large subunit-like protein
MTDVGAVLEESRDKAKEKEEAAVALNRLVMATRMAWKLSARPEQIPVPGLWHTYLVLAGRGFGKTKLAAEWIWWEAWNDPKSYSHVIAPTWDSDLIGVCFEGPSGILKCCPPQIVKTWNKSEAILTLTSGSVIRGFSAEKPARLRGPECSRIWGDELAAWAQLEETWDMAMFGLRRGNHVQSLFTTTPRPVPKIVNLLKQAEEDKRKGREGVVVVRGTTYDNKANLSKTFFNEIVSKYEGTTQGRQEIYAEVIDPEEMGVIKRSWWKLWKGKLPPFQFIIMSLDTAYSEQDRDKKTGETDYSACTVWGLFTNPSNGRDNVMLLDAWQDKLGFPDLLRRVQKELAITYGERTMPDIKPSWGKPMLALGGGRKVDLVIIEEKAAGKSLIQSLAQEGVIAYGYNPGREGKLLRLHSVSHIFANGMVWAPEGSKAGEFLGCLEEPMSQICTFAGEKSTRHDDYVDTATQAIRYLTDRNIITVLVPPEKDLDAEEADRAYKRKNPYK